VKDLLSQLRFDFMKPDDKDFITSIQYYIFCSVT